MTSLSARVTSPDLDKGTAYGVPESLVSITENTGKLFGVILDVFVPIFLMANPSVIFFLFQGAPIQRSAFVLFLVAAGDLLSNTLSRRQVDTQVNICTGVPDEHEVCLSFLHVHRVFKHFCCYCRPISLMST